MTRKNTGLGAAAIVALTISSTGHAYAGGLAEPLMEPEVIVEETAAASVPGGIVIPLLLLALVAFAAVIDGGGGTVPPVGGCCPMSSRASCPGSASLPRACRRCWGFCR